MPHAAEGSSQKFRAQLGDFSGSLKKFRNVLQRGQAEKTDQIVESQVVGRLTGLIGAFSSAGETDEPIIASVLSLLDIIESIGEVSQSRKVNNFEDMDYRRKILKSLQDIEDQANGLLGGISEMQGKEKEATSGLFQKLIESIEEKKHYLLRTH